MNSNRPVSLLSEVEYRDRVLALAEPIADIEQVPLGDSLSRVLARELVSKVDIPPFRNSAMDGYAVIASDTEQVPVTLKVISDIAAGSTSELEVTSGNAARIMTGAPIPPGADSIVPVEWTDAGADQVEIRQSPTFGYSVRGAAEDLSVGMVVGSPGELVDPGAVGLLAASGHAEVPVTRRPRVAVVATGDELYPVGTELPPGGIYDSNSHQGAALVQRAGAELGDVITLSDDIDQAVESMTQLARNHDLIVTSGGVSAGAYEVIKDVFAALGGADFIGVAIQPGKPQGNGMINGTPVVCLPGNPLSSFVSFELFVRPLIRKLSGLANYASPEANATCVVDLKRRSDRTRYMPAVLDYTSMTSETPLLHVSNRVSIGKNANCLMRVPGTHLDPPGLELGDTIPAGSTVRVVLID